MYKKVFESKTREYTNSKVGKITRYSFLLQIRSSQQFFNQSGFVGGKVVKTDKDIEFFSGFH